MSRGLLLLALTPGLAAGLVLTGSGPALADAPQRTAWYSTFAAGGTALPAPTTPDPDLRVQGAGSTVTAYAAVGLTAPGSSGGDLVLAVRSGAVGTPQVAACPTSRTDWTAGGDQPADAGPGFDCSTAQVLGTLSTDGTSISFPLDRTLQSAPGAYSVALVPLPSGTVPFSVDLGDPVFTPAVAAAAPAAPAASASPAASARPSATAAAVPAGGDAPLPAASAVPAAPVLADAPLPAADVPAPQTAPSADPAAAAVDPAPAAVLPGAVLAAGSTPQHSDGQRLLALLALVAVSAGAGYAVGQQRPAPRLLGGRALAAGSGTAVVAAGPAPEPDALPRGIGRFSRLRDAAPRSLR